MIELSVNRTLKGADPRVTLAVKFAVGGGGAVIVNNDEAPRMFDWVSLFTTFTYHGPANVPFVVRLQVIFVASTRTTDDERISAEPDLLNQTSRPG